MSRFGPDEEQEQDDIDDLFTLIDLQAGPEELQQQIEESQDALVAIRKLLESQGWSYLERILKLQVKHREKSNSAGFNQIEDIFNVQRNAGEISGLLTALSMPESLVMALTEDINRGLRVLENATGTESATGDPDFNAGDSDKPDTNWTDTWRRV